MNNVIQSVVGQRCEVCGKPATHHGTDMIEGDRGHWEPKARHFYCWRHLLLGHHELKDGRKMLHGGRFEPAKKMAAALQARSSIGSITSDDDGDAEVSAMYGSGNYAWLPEYTTDFSPRTKQMSAAFQTAWSDIGSIPQQFLGDVSVSGGGGLSRTPPLQHPVTSWAYATRVGLRRGVGAFRMGSNGLIAFYDNNGQNASDSAGDSGRAQWEVTWEPLPYAVIGDGQLGTGATGTELDRYVIRTSDFNLEALALPGNSWQFLTPVNGKLLSIPEGIAIQIPTLHLVYIWVMVPDSLWQSIKTGVLPSVMGCCNGGTFDGMADSTVLCLAPKESELYFSAGGTPVRDIGYSFLQKGILGVTWNMIFHRDLMIFDQVIGVNDPTKQPYGKANFLSLFQGP